MLLFLQCPSTKELEHRVPWALSLPAPEDSASLFVPLIGGCGPKEGPMQWPLPLPLLVAEESRTGIFSQYQRRFWPYHADHQASPGLGGPHRALSVLWMTSITSPRTGGPGRLTRCYSSNNFLLLNKDELIPAPWLRVNRPVSRREGRMPLSDRARQP